MRVFLLIISVFIVVSCSHGPKAPKYSVPDPPQSVTVAGQGCAIKCREADYDCKMACRGTKDELLECVSVCNQELDRCYKLCMEILE
jgi:hypothetical protein